MLPGLELMGCQNLAVPVEVMRHVVSVESGANPFAIGVVGARLVRQPKNLDEAVATANMLEANGYNYSLGLAQVNRVNFDKYGLDTPAKAFDVCNNLTAGADILANCYRDAKGDWGKAFSCYYSGNFTTGFLQGYVQKIYNSILRNVEAATHPAAAAAIPVLSASSAAYAVSLSAANSRAWLMKAATLKPPAAQQSNLPAEVTQRVVMRSMPIDKTAGVVAPSAAPVAAAPPPLAPQPSPPPALSPPGAPVTGRANDIFVPQVRGPHDRPPAAAVAAPGAGDPADRRKPVRDSAFVF